MISAFFIFTKELSSVEQKKQEAAGRYTDELERHLQRQGLKTSREPDGIMTAYFRQKEFCRLYLDRAISFRGADGKEWNTMQSPYLLTLPEPE